jgi:phage gp45-like
VDTREFPMRALLIFVMAAMLVLTACETQSLFPNNQTNHTEGNQTLPEDNQTAGEDLFSPPEDAHEEPSYDDDKYAARINAVEGETIQLQTRAVDPDGGEVTLTFGAPFNQSGAWATREGDAGEYDVTIVASDGTDEAEIMILVVVDRANRPPAIQGPSVIHVREGQWIDLNVFEISDPDGDDFIVSYAGWMNSSRYRTTFDDAGVYTVRIIAEDSAGNMAEREVTIEVENVNRPPVLEIQDASITVLEGEVASIMVMADDPDGDEVTITYGEPFDEDGTWQTTEGDAGTYEVDVRASDGEDVVQRTVTVTVEVANRPPVIEGPSVIRVKEGETIDLEALYTITDPEGEDVTVRYSGWMTTAVYTTNYEDSGEYEVTISASDSVNTANKSVTVIVEDVNRPPVFIRPA